jgi:molybdate transport system substrate-binding protein
MMRAPLAFCLLAGLAGCAGTKPQAVTIFVAVSAREPVEQIARDFQAQTGTPVTCNPGASSTLARQIEQGAGADLFLSADEHWADYLADRDMTVARSDLLGNRLVVVTPAEHPVALARLADLAGDKVQHLALALDPVPAGRYAREALRKAGVWEQVKDRVREAGDVRATLALVVREEAEAGMVYVTDAAATGKVRVALEVPEELHTLIRYPLVLIRRASISAPARAFYEFLAGESAQAHFRKAGFRVVH